MRRKYLFVITIIVLAGSVNANPNSQSLKECVLIENNEKRLNCFDLLTVHLKKSSKVATKTGLIPTKEVAFTEAKVEDVSEKRESESQSAVEIFGVEHNRKIDGPEELTFTIKKVITNPYGQRKFIFENGQVWQQTDSIKKGKFKTGSGVIIKRGALNSFSLKKSGASRTLKVKRIK